MAPKEDEFRCEVDYTDKTINYGPFSWMVRPCEWYLQEYRDCKSLRGRIHQYFISGSIADCDDWRDDYYNCSLFRKTKDAEILNRIINSELLRKKKRMSQTIANDVWQYRTEPPSDWNKPLQNDETSKTNDNEAKSP